MEERLHGKYASSVIRLMLRVVISDVSSRAHRKRIAAGGEGSTNIDELHRQVCHVFKPLGYSFIYLLQKLLDSMLASPKWEALSKMWDEDKRKEVNLVWHRLHGAPEI